MNTATMKKTEGVLLQQKKKKIHLYWSISQK